jgi:glycosyltransferase involved in cell wall biosynthesis
MMKNDMTVIIPVGEGHEKFIRDAIYSCLMADPHPEAIKVVIDGANDSLMECLKGDFKVVDVVQLGKHRGRSYARNFAAKESTTDWLYFLDADDFLEATAIADFKDRLQHHPGMHLLYGDYDFINNNDGEKIRVKKPPFVYSALPALRLRNLVNIGMFVIRDRFLAMGGFDEDMAIAEYWDMFLKYTAGRKAVVIKNGRPLFTARQSSSVLPNSEELMAQATRKIQSLIRANYYDNWKNI